MGDYSKYFEIIVTTATDAVVVIDCDSTIVYANPALSDVFGYTARALFGSPLTMLMPDDMGAIHMRSLNRYLKTGERHVQWGCVRLTGLHRDGRSIPLEVSFSEYQDDTDHVFIGIMRTMSEHYRVNNAIGSLPV